MINTKTSRDLHFESILWFLFCLAIAFNLVQLVLSWNEPILGAYAFRQTQTAISSYWIAKGGSWLAYPTPVLGSPWSIPFEFPLYQWLAAGLAAIFPSLVTLDQAGRLVSEVFFLACLWPAWRIATRFNNGCSIFMVCSIIVLLSPLYIFWSRSFMMESTVLLFSMWFVASVGDFLDHSSVYGLIEMILVASLAACIKITTFVGFSFAAALLVVLSFWISRGTPHKIKNFLRYALIGLTVAVSILALLVWLRFSDTLKSSNILGTSFQGSSPGMMIWNFGTLAQRKSMELWHVALVRAPDEAIGNWAALALLGIYAVIRLSWRQLIVIASLFALYLSVFFVFTNLHLIHHYYQYANSIFLMAAAGYILHAGLQRDKAIAFVLLLVVCTTEIFGFYTYFYDDMIQPNRQLQTMLSTFIRETIPDSDMFIATGLSWSSEVPYYAERRALMIPDNATQAELTAISKDLSQVTGGLPVGAVVVCPNSFQSGSNSATPYTHLMSQLSRDRHPHIVGYCKVYN